MGRRGEDARVHYEHQFGNVRYDYTTGRASIVVGDGARTHVVVDDDGDAHFERQFGPWRVNLDNGDTTFLL